MTRVYICKEWEPSKGYERIVVLTDDKPSAERWRRDGPSRNYTDFIVLSKDEFAKWLAGEVETREFVDGGGWVK